MDAQTGDGEGGARIRALRAELEAAHVTSFFKTPKDLAHEVTLAMSMMTTEAAAAGSPGQIDAGTTHRPASRPQQQRGRVAVDAAPTPAITISHKAAVVQITTGRPEEMTFGTGFVVHKAEGATYILTSASVVSAAHDASTITADGRVAVVAASAGGGIDEDLAVLRVDEQLPRPPMPLRGAGETGVSILIAGFGRHDALRVVPGELGDAVGLENDLYRDRLRTWDLRIADGHTLEHGDSGSPVVDRASGDVVGVVSYRQGEPRGRVIAVEELKRVWPEAPLQLQEEQEASAAMEEIRQHMASLIPDFDEKFPGDFRDKLISQVRRENLFKVKTARALVFGQTGVGKTTTINYLLDKPVFPTTGKLTCTQSLAAGEHRGGLIFFDSPGLEDEPFQENMTRVTLGIRQLDEEPVTSIRFIDITANGVEGPDDFDRLSFEDFRDEIEEEYYRANEQRIVFKDFSVETFKEWVEGRFDFLVFVTSSRHGLPVRQARLIRDLYESLTDGPRLFKVFNVFDASFSGDQGELTGSSLEKLEQAKSRLSKLGVPAADQWLSVNSLNGTGVDQLVRSFADTLPVEVLRNLHQVISQKYSRQIEERLSALFVDYVSHVAALVSVFPVNFRRQRTNFLQFAIAGLVPVAEYVYSGSRATVPAKLLDELVADLKAKKRKAKYETQYQDSPFYAERTVVVDRPVLREEIVLERKESAWRSFVSDAFNIDAWRLGGYVERPQLVERVEQVEEVQTVLESRQVPRQVRVGTYYAVGGIAAMKLALSLGLTLQTVHTSAQRAPLDARGFEAVLGKSRKTIDDRVDRSRRQEVERLIKSAKRQNTTAGKVAVAEELYPHVRQMLRGRGKRR